MQPKLNNITPLLSALLAITNNGIVEIFPIVFWTDNNGKLYAVDSDQRNQSGISNILFISIITDCLTHGYIKCRELHPRHFQTIHIYLPTYYTSLFCSSREFTNGNYFSGFSFCSFKLSGLVISSVANSYFGYGIKLTQTKMHGIQKALAMRLSL